MELLEIALVVFVMLTAIQTMFIQHLIRRNKELTNQLMKMKKYFR